MYKKLFLFITIFIFVGGGCSLTQKIGKVDNDDQKIGGNKDEHGCLVSAGEQYCPSTDKCQRMWNEYCEEYKDQFKVFNFDDCVEAGNAVMESYPRQCRHNGELFIEDVAGDDGCGLPNANWIEEHNECEYAPKDWCELKGGEYLPCESACRHNEDAEICTKQCVPVCKFKEGDTEKYSYKDLVELENPTPNQKIESPLIVKGQARGNWYFEGDFPVVLTDWDGKIIAKGVASAKDSWMTEEYVPFEATLEFDKPENIGDFSNKGSLILQKNNPSGLPENDDVLEVQVLFK